MDKNTLVIAVGACGNTISQNLIKNHSTLDTDFLYIDAEISYEESVIHDELTIGENGLGCGGNQECGRTKVLDSKTVIMQKFDGYSKIIFIAGLAGGMAGSVPLMAEWAEQKNIFAAGIAIMPFGFEGSRKIENAETALEKWKNSLKMIFVLEDDKFCKLAKSLKINIPIDAMDDFFNIP